MAQTFRERSAEQLVSKIQHYWRTSCDVYLDQGSGHHFQRLDQALDLAQSQLAELGFDATAACFGELEAYEPTIFCTTADPSCDPDEFPF